MITFQCCWDHSADRYGLWLLCAYLYYLIIISLNTCGHSQESPCLVALSMQQLRTSSPIGCPFLVQMTLITSYVMWVLLKLIKNTYTFLGFFVVAANIGFKCLLNLLFFWWSPSVMLYTMKSHSLDGRWKGLTIWISHITLVTLISVCCIFVYLPWIIIF